jgi:hypothetical protein
MYVIFCSMNCWCSNKVTEFKEIEFKSDKNDYMRFLFSAIVGFPLQRKLIFYKAFLNKNKEFDDFKVLPFEPTTLRVVSTIIVTN